MSNIRSLLFQRQGWHLVAWISFGLLLFPLGRLVPQGSDRFMGWSLQTWLVFSWLAAGLMFSVSIQAQQKKNLLFIMTDQQRYDALSIAGNEVLETPNLDRLAAQGAWFTRAYTTCAVCAPARSSILTGYTVENTGMRRNDRAYFFDEEEVMTMPTFDEILSEQGYHCEYSHGGQENSDWNWNSVPYKDDDNQYQANGKIKKHFPDTGEDECLTWKIDFCEKRFGLVYNP